MSQLNSVTQNWGWLRETIVHLGQLTDRNVARNLGAPGRPAVRVRIVTPDVQLRARGTRLAMRCLNRNAQQVAHEPHRRDDLDVFRIVRERSQSPGDNGVSRRGGVHGAGERVDHFPVVGG